MKIHEQQSTVEHEASVSKIGEDQLFYAMSPRPFRSRRDRVDRQRILRLLRQGVADGIRGRVEPSRQDGDGRRRRLDGPFSSSCSRARSCTGVHVRGILSREAAIPATMVDRVDSATAYPGMLFRFKTTIIARIDDVLVPQGSIGYLASCARGPRPAITIATAPSRSNYARSFSVNDIL